VHRSTCGCPAARGVTHPEYEAGKRGDNRTKGGKMKKKGKK